MVTRNLVGQWRTQSAKFLGKNSSLDALFVSNAADLGRLSLEALARADLVVVSSGLFESVVYRRRCDACLVAHDTYEAAAKAAVAGGLLPCLFELFYWRVVLCDEIQESLYDKRDRDFEALARLRCESFVGMSASLPLQHSLAIHRLGRLVGVDIEPNDKSSECPKLMDAQSLDRLRRVLGTCAWSRSADLGLAAVELPKPRRVEHRVSVKLSGAEMATYLSKAADASVEEIMHLCTYHLDEASCAEEECERLKVRKKRDVVEAEKKLRAAVQALRVVLRLYEENPEPHVPAGLLRGRCMTIASVQVGKDSDALLLRLWQEDLVWPAPVERRADWGTILGVAMVCKDLRFSHHRATRAALFLQEAFASLTSGAAWACSICLTDGAGAGGRRSILKCGHTFCCECLAASLQERRACPMCRDEVQDGDVHVLPANSPEAPLGEFQRFGSKLSAVVLTLQEIRREDVRAKVIFFVQFEGLAKKVEEALKAFSVPCVRLQGTAVHRDKVIRAWQEGSDDAYVLLLSLKTASSGVELTAANHVVLMHPTYASSEEVAKSFEEQAIHRALRPGQTREEVHVWRFVTQGTYEEKLCPA